MFCLLVFVNVPIKMVTMGYMFRRLPRRLDVCFLLLRYSVLDKAVSLLLFPLSHSSDD